MLGTTYLIYVAISLLITVSVGWTLNRNGIVFLLENYPDKPQVAKAINQMLLVGFYLINIGFISYTLRITGEPPVTWAQTIEFLSTKIGFIAIVIGVMHFGLMIALQKYGQIRLSKPALS